MEKSVSQRLTNLSKLQEIDSKIDEIHKVRGDLPEEVQDLEDEIAGLQTREDRFIRERETFEKAIVEKREAIKKSEGMIAKYEEQQMNVRNNREYDAITKELELQDLEIQISNKKINEANAGIEAKEAQITEIKGRIDERKKDLDNKKAELDVIMSETEVEEQKLLEGRKKAADAIERRLYESYQRIRKNARNGLAVVSVKRGACGGCFNMVPPQTQADIRERKKLIVCEHCGRILTDVEEIIEEEKPKKKTTRKKATAKAKA